jgi:kinesin family protein 6/9
MIKNDVMVNEELDPKLMIQKLKREVQQLREELALATGEQRTDDLSEEDLNRSLMVTECFNGNCSHLDLTDLLFSLRL